MSEIFARLAAAIPTPHVELDHDSPWQLLIATILSARSTDARVNQVTPTLFARFPTPAALAAAPQEEVEEIVRSTGFYRNKARAIREASQALVTRFGGEVPTTLEALTSLRGVARKTANLVLGTAMGIPSGIVVDTHVQRVARRLGLTAASTPTRIERDLMALLPRDQWVDMGHRLLLHGRAVCTAKAPDCPSCPLNEVCPSAEAPPEGSVDARISGERERIARRRPSA